MTMGLDDTDRVARIDSSNMIGAIDRLPEDLLKPASLPEGEMRFGRSGARNLVLAGMGGSASAGDVLLDWLRSKLRIPAIVHREPVLPRFVGPETLLIAISYSGETAETLGAFRAARERGCSLVGVGTGGRLESLCLSFHVPFVPVPSTVAPRAALARLMVATANVLDSLRLVESVRQDLLRAADDLGRLRKRVEISKPSSRNPAKQLASRMFGHFVAIYTLQRMLSVGRRFKNQLAENSKVLAKYTGLPEACHNEVEAWGRRRSSWVPLLIHDWEESRAESAVWRAFGSTIRRASGAEPLELRLKAQGQLSRLLCPIFFLDYVSVYLAVLEGVDPTPTPLIAEYKRI